MNPNIKMTGTTMKVLDMFLTDPRQRLCGADIVKETEMLVGTLYPILRRLEENGWLSLEVEDIDPSKEGRPRRYYYRMKAEARPVAHAKLVDREYYAEPLPAFATGWVR